MQVEVCGMWGLGVNDWNRGLVSPEDGCINIRNTLSIK